jgi:hypothetical protein
MKKIYSLSIAIFMIVSIGSVGGLPTLDEAGEFYFSGDGNGFGMTIDMASWGDSTEIEFGGDETGVSMYLIQGETIVFSMDEVPDWNTNPRNNATIKMETLNGTSDYNYMAPWTQDPDTVDGAPLFTPFIAVGDGTYQNDMFTAFEDIGYTVFDFDDSFTVQYVNTSNVQFANATFNKNTGIMEQYYVYGEIDDDGTLTTVEILMNFKFIFDPQNETWDWFSQEPMLSYFVDVAGFSNGTEGWYLGDFNDEKGDYGEGYIYAGQLIEVNLRDFVSGDGPESYWAYLRTETGFMNMNITIDLPNENPGENNMFFYPLFPIVSDELLNGYLGLSEIASANYDYQISDNNFTISYMEGDSALWVTWDKETGVLTHFSMRMDESDSEAAMSLEFHLVFATTMEELEMEWPSTTLVNEYQMETLDFDGNHTMDLDDSDPNAGFIQEGDNFTISIDDFQLPSQDAPFALYNLIGPNADAIINITISYPGSTEFDGPPLLYFHMLTGSGTFYDWIKTLYEHAGAVVIMTSTSLSIDWNFLMEDREIDMYVEWDLSNANRLVEYEYSEISSQSYANMHIILLGEGSINDSSTTSEETPLFNIPVSWTPIFMGLIAIVTLLRRRK